MKQIGRMVATALVALGASAAQAADVVIGVPNWPSVNATAHVLKVIIEDNYGMDVELQNATNPIIFEAMDSGSMHVHPEVWLPNQANLHDKFVKSKGTVLMNPNGVSSFQGMCVTKYTGGRIRGDEALRSHQSPTSPRSSTPTATARVRSGSGVGLGVHQRREDPCEELRLRRDDEPQGN